MQWQAAASKCKCSVQTKVFGLPFLPSVFTCVRSWGSVTGMSTRVRGGRSGVRGPNGRKIFFASTKFAERLCRFTDYYSVDPGHFPVVKLSEVKPSSPSVAEDKNMGSYTFTSLIPSWCKQGNFTSFHRLVLCNWIWLITGL